MPDAIIKYIIKKPHCRGHVTTKIANNCINFDHAMAGRGMIKNEHKRTQYFN